MKKITTVLAVASLAGVAAAQVESQWNFDGNLNSAFGSGILDYWTPDAESKTTFGTASSFGIGSAPDGGDPGCAYVDFTNDLETFVCLHGAPANGGGAYVNDYTLIWDMYIPQSSLDNFGWLGFYNTNASNSNDGDHFVRASDGAFGVADLTYGGLVSGDTWHRFAVTFETDGDGNVQHSKYIDGTLVGVGETTLDGRFSLYTGDNPDTPWFHVIADNDGDMMPCYVSSFYMADYAWDSASIRDLGCVAADGATSPGPDCSTQDGFCNTPADFDNNGVVDTRDFIAFLDSWADGCP